MIARTAHDTLIRLAKGFPIIAITGPRQSGKTTLARSAFSDKAYLSLEDPDVRLMAESDSRGLLPFSLDELLNANKLPEDLGKVMFRGLYPPLYDCDLSPGDWCAGYVNIY